MPTHPPAKGGVTQRGSEDSEEGERSGVCGSEYCFPPVCVCVLFPSAYITQ